MSKLTQAQMVKALIKEAAAHPGWGRDAIKIHDTLKRAVSRAYAIDLLVEKLRTAEAIGFGRGLECAEKIARAILEEPKNDRHQAGREQDHRDCKR